MEVVPGTRPMIPSPLEPSIVSPSVQAFLATGDQGPYNGAMPVVRRRLRSMLGPILGLTSLTAAAADKPIDVSVEPVRTACQEVQACRPSCDGVEADEE